MTFSESRRLTFRISFVAFLILVVIVLFFTFGRAVNEFLEINSFFVCMNVSGQIE